RLSTFRLPLSLKRPKSLSIPIPPILNLSKHHSLYISLAPLSVLRSPEMALEIQVPCASDGVCMRCKVAVPSEECLTCSTCVTPWHVSCLRSPPKTLASTQAWECPDCSGVVDPVPVSGSNGFNPDGSTLVAAIRAIEADESLTEAQKAKKKQRLLNGKAVVEEDEEKSETNPDGVLAALKESFQCVICLELPEKPVTTSCGHNYCLKCFQKWAAKRGRACWCRKKLAQKMIANPRINLTLVAAIRMAKDSGSSSVAPPKVQHYISDQDRPEQAFTTDRAVKSGKANACCGRRGVTSPTDHFGPIGPEYDPSRNRGVLVGDTWEDRLHCKQWGAHNPHIAGIAGQSGHGAQSVALSGGYEEDQDHGEWFLYTGSGGRNLKGNKRTNKEQSFDQKFSKGNKALKRSCKMGYPVRVIRTHKDKRSAYAPTVEKTVRYDGVYRIEKCWMNVGVQGFKMCRFLFVRCDNEAAPWTSDVTGDRPRPIPNVPELRNAIDLYEREDSPSWDFDESDGRWKWVKSPPASRMIGGMNKGPRKGRKSSLSIRDQLLKSFGCPICKDVLKSPVSTPCGHNFCKDCLTAKFAGISVMKDRSRGGRTLRAKKNVMKCPCCKYDIAEIVQDPQVNRDFESGIEKLKKEEEEEAAAEKAKSEEELKAGEDSSDGESEDEDEDEADEEGREEPQIVAKHEPARKKRKVASVTA
ncbi:unnamed protein product, partial [Thlaspi arvense]